MSKDFSSDNCFPSSIELTNLRFSPQNFKNYNIGMELTNIYANKFNNQSVTFPYQPDRLRERLPEILQQLHSFKPLCSSGNQRELARKALTALKNRAQEDIRYLAKSLADDVADAVD